MTERMFPLGSRRRALANKVVGFVLRFAPPGFVEKLVYRHIERAVRDPRNWKKVDLAEEERIDAESWIEEDLRNAEASAKMWDVIMSERELRRELDEDNEIDT